MQALVDLIRSVQIVSCPQLAAQLTEVIVDWSEDGLFSGEKQVGKGEFKIHVVRGRPQPNILITLTLTKKPIAK